jgi:hypothetical protein
VYIPALRGPAGVNEVALASKVVPPVGAANQSTNNPAAGTTVSGGIGFPVQTEGLLAPLAAATGGQAQLGAVIVCCFEHPFMEVALSVTFVPTGIKLIVNEPLPAITVPTVAVSMEALEVMETAYVVKSGAHKMVPVIRVGSAFTVMVELTGVPGHVPKTGVTVIFPTSVVVRLGAALNTMLPIPEAARPIVGLLFVHEKTGPRVPVKLTVTGSPGHTLTLEGVVIFGTALTVRVTGVRALEIHPVAESRVSA